MTMLYVYSIFYININFVSLDYTLFFDVLFTFSCLLLPKPEGTTKRSRVSHIYADNDLSKFWNYGLTHYTVIYLYERIY